MWFLSHLHLRWHEGIRMCPGGEVGYYEIGIVKFVFVIFIIAVRG